MHPLRRAADVRSFLVSVARADPLHLLLVARSSGRVWLPHRLPMTVRALQSKGSTVPVVLVLCGVGAVAGVLVVVAFTMPEAAGARGGSLVVHRVAAGIFAGHAIFTDAICWSCTFRAAVRRRELGESLLGDPRMGDRYASSAGAPVELVAPLAHMSLRAAN
jgi:hypothetical protein